MGIVTALLNNQIMKYASADALAVYGVIVYVSTFVQCCGYSVGQAAQLIISSNLGAHKLTVSNRPYTMLFSQLWDLQRY